MIYFLNKNTQKHYVEKHYVEKHHIGDTTICSERLRNVMCYPFSCVLQLVRDYCLTLNEQLFRYIMASKVTFDNMMTMSVLY